jgi:hypothetical protein
MPSIGALHLGCAVPEPIPMATPEKSREAAKSAKATAESG